MAQRLVRRPCLACAVLQRPSPDTIEKAGGLSRLRPDGQWTVGRGCEKCGNTGVKGRIAIHEVLVVNDEIRDLISERASEQAIRKAAKRGGMRTMFEDGLEKAAQGLTTLDELLRVVSPDELAATDSVTKDSVTKDSVTKDTKDTKDTGTKDVTAGDPAGGPEQEPRQRRVLVVEDSPTVSSVVKYFLELDGLEVLVAGDGLVGLEMALREHPDIIVSDVNMPSMGGVAMVKAIRLDPRMSDVRILMLTSESSVECETEGLAAGADDYILKPVEPRRLAARVKALLARSSSRAA
jgi:type IV pilus assembly protein PilB